MRSLQDGREGGGAPGAGWPAAGGAGRAHAVLSLVVALTLAPTGAAQALPDPPAPPWESAFDRHHPLAGRIWDVRANGFSSPSALAERLAAARFVLLGEQHDNPDHHRLQAWALRALMAAGRRPAVAFEMFTAADGPALARHLAGKPRDAAGLGEALGWSRSRWPPWQWYQPIAEAALAAGLPLVPANLDPAATGALLRHGMAALDPQQAAKLGLDRPLAPEVRAEMADEIRESHCGVPIPEERLDGMIAVQRARDAQMAERMAAGAPEGAVLIAGAGHVRADRGVPAYLARLVPNVVTVSLAFLEVRPDATRPEAYAAAFGRGPLPVDFVWFTPRADDRDPCDKYRESLQRLRRPKPPLPAP